MKLKKKITPIILITLVFFLIAIGITFSQKLKYKAQAQILVVQQFAGDIDPYSASRMNEYLSGLLSRIVYSESFFKQTVEDNKNIDASYFDGNQRTQSKLWNNTIKSKTLYDSGIITLNVYHPDKDQATKILQSAIFTLKTTNNFYHSIQNVDIRIIDSPSVSLFPVKPNIILNGLIGILFGLIIGVLYVMQKESSKGVLARMRDKLS